MSPVGTSVALTRMVYSMRRSVGVRSGGSETTATTDRPHSASSSARSMAFASDGNPMRNSSMTGL